MGTQRLEAFLLLENRLQHFPPPQNPDNVVELDHCTCSWSTPVKQTPPDAASEWMEWGF